MGFFDCIFGSGVPNIPTLQKNRDVDGLIKALMHNQTIVREQAAQALGAIEGDRSIDPLIRSLSDPSTDVQLKAAQSLKQYDSAEIMTKIAMILNDRGAYKVKQAMVTFVSQLDDQTKAAIAIDRDYDLKIRLAATDKITDQNLLCQVFIDAHSWEISLSAIDKINDRTILTKIADHNVSRFKLDSWNVDSPYELDRIAKVNKLLDRIIATIEKKLSSQKS
jgi:hypothetical protein